MKKYFLRLIGAALCFVLLSASAQADSFLIVPGHSLGRIWLGAPLATVHKLWGAPGSSGHANLYTVEHWKLGKDGDYSKTAVFKKGHVVQLETDYSGFKTAAGLSMDSNLAAVRRVMGKLRVISFGEHDPEPQMAEHAAHYYSSKKRGVTFELDLGYHADTSSTVTPHSIIIHCRGHNFLHLSAA